MLLYLLAGGIGFIIHMLYTNSRPHALDTQIYGYLKRGHRVIIAVNNDATIMKMMDGKIRIQKAVADFYDEDLPDGELLNGMDATVLPFSESNKSNSDTESSDPNKT